MTDKHQPKSAWDDEVVERGDKQVSPPRTDEKSWGPFLIGSTLGVLLGGVALAAIVVMFVQDSQRTTSKTAGSTSSTATSSSSTTTTTAAPLPPQCSNYTVVADATRNITYSASSACDTSVFGTTGIWVRFQSPGGTTIPTSAPSVHSCGTDAPGWYNGSYSSSVGSTAVGTVCYSWAGATCDWSNQISITNCSGYFVFLLIGPPNCSLRYCTV